ncbi:hypothetical protein BN14_10661 [Rhizoctonia solani AG-1 IB]|uniref:Retrotransposon gag domain-containing protein n=1 Tax=Thanatephorus cucumeris (strain AG1-IB / isolate 7/3/14) TaxID=1108050 RepID=M5C938_THACB|nr:hypothetical protein BN14_10661 [Rhizoctonia solani AG-1 IB]
MATSGQNYCQWKQGLHYIHPLATTTQSLSQTPGGSLKPIKVKAPEPFKGGTRTEARQWMARMSRWLQLSTTQFEREEDVVTYLLVNTAGTVLAWALLHLANIGTDKAAIRTVAKFDTAFARAFYDPNKQRAAKQKINTLVQTTTTVTYAKELRTLLMSIDSNDIALQAQFYKGLNWHIRQRLVQKEVQPQDLEVLIATAICIDNVCWEFRISQMSRENQSEPTTSTRTPGTGTPCVDSACLKLDPNYVSEAER